MAESEKKAKVLVVEDDIFMIELLAKDLQGANYEVVIAKTGAEGVKKFEEERPHIILLDLLLPDVGGFEALRQIRRLPGGNTVKVMVLSNIGEGPDIEEAKRLGVNDYLIKANFTLPEIISKIEEVLKK